MGQEREKKDISSLLEDNIRHIPEEYQLKECVFDWSAPEETLDVLLYQENGEKVLFTRENLSLITGPEKSGKTFLTNILATACLGKPFMGLLTNKNNLKIAVFDTEQGGCYIRRTATRTFKLLEWPLINNDRYRHYNLICLGCEQRLAAIQYFIEEHKPDVVFIDGIVDLVDDFNNNTQSSKIVTILNALAARNRCHICGVLHTNKSDNNPRGHIGSIYRQKCETVLNIEYTKQGMSGYMTVSAGSCRNEPFNTFLFRIEGRGESAIPVYFASPVPDDPKVEKYKCLNEIFHKNGNSPMPSMVLNGCLQPILEKHARAVSTYISEAKRDGILTENRHGNEVHYSLARFEPPTKKEGDVFDEQE